MTRPVVIGTAGHIDHGKTALVRALTGVDTDRLAEEKRRGITIDLGFAHLELPDGSSAGVVDVPGHEDFIRNMVAGASGIDVALLVVAADEGVMPQTREHLAILRMLGVEHAVVALTKSDLVDEEWLALASDDLAVHLTGTPYARAAVVAVSARTGAGLDDLRAALLVAAREAAQRPHSTLFRMPVDRVFTVRGTGTVVTGTVRDGEVAVGSEVRVLPAQIVARVRGIQLHGMASDRAAAGSRTALALTGLERDQAARGSWVVAGDWPLSSMLTVSLRLIDESAWELRQRQRVRVHIGTAEVMGRVVLLETDRMRAGETALAQLRLESPVVACRGDRFVVRSYSPVTTIGGGLVLEPAARKRRRAREEDRLLLEALTEDGASALPALVEAAGWAGLPLAELPFRLGTARPPDPDSHPSVRRVGEHLVARRRFDSAVDALVQTVARFHRDHPLRTGMEHAEARRAVEPEAGRFADSVIDGAVAAGRLERREGALAVPDFQARTDAGQAAARQRLETLWLDAALAPPRLEDLPPELRDRPDLRDLIALLERDGVLLPFPPDRLVHARALAEARSRLVAALGGRSGLGPADFRELFDLPRKHLIPLLELFDRLGWTRREGDVRSVPEKGVASETVVPTR